MADQNPLIKSAESVAEEIRAIKALMESRGWALILATLHKEREVAIRHITGSPTTSKEELDFLRSSLRAIDTLIDLPKNLKTMLESELMLAKPTKEGK